MKINLLKISKLVYSFLLSLILFSLLLKDIKLNLYLTIYGIILFLFLMILNHKVNAEQLCYLMLLGIVVSTGYVVAKSFSGNIYIPDLANRELVPYIYRMIVLMLIEAENIYICILQRKVRKNKADTDDSKINRCNTDLFSERKADMERLHANIEAFDTIGVLGEWGSGKTYLVDEYIRRNIEKYEVIKIETLTCNLDKIDSYLFQQLENVLWQNRIYPKYSKQIQSMMSEKGILRQLQSIIMKGTTANITAFHGFCNDIQKLNKQILLVCEDIDRISENDVGQIAKILDLCAKLAGKNVKVIYEYDQNKMTELGFGREYMEKYIPHMMNLTDISFRKLIHKALEEINERNGNLCEEDFRFLSSPIYVDPFLSEKLGINFNLEVHSEKITPRKVKVFVDEVNLTLRDEEFAATENRKIVITFYFLKNFMVQLYEQIPFRKNIQDEIEFERCIGSYYSIMELVDLLENKVIKTGEVLQLFVSDKHQIEKEYVVWNRNKLALLLMLGFHFKYLQRYYEKTHEVKKTKRSNPILEEETFEIQCIEHNAKINRLLKNLYMNGKSQYTNNEANTSIFIDQVLFAPAKEQEKKWHEYLNRCYRSQLYKDNQTIFLVGGDDWLSLAKALRTAEHFPKYRKKTEEIKKRFLDFWMSHLKDKQLLLETVTTFRFIEPESKISFIKAITYFNELEITGNMNTEKVYYDFLDTYINIAYRLGYLFNGYYYHMINEMYDISDTTGSDLKDTLERILNELQNTIKEKKIPPSSQVEFEQMAKFIEKNIKIIDTTKHARYRRWKPEVTVSEKIKYQNETIYLKLKELAVRKDANFPEIINEEYDKGNITLLEYRRLYQIYLG